MVLTCFIGILTRHCKQICTVLPNCTCAFFYNPVILTESVSMGGWDENKWTLVTARLIISFILLLHFGKNNVNSIFYKDQSLKYMCFYLLFENVNGRKNIFSVVISMGFIKRNHLIYRKPHINMYWLATIFVL